MTGLPEEGSETNAARANALLEAGVKRLRAAALRLGLSDEATAVSEALLRAEIDPVARAALLGDQAGRIAPWRADLLRAVSHQLPPEAAMRGLLELERCQVVRPLRGSVGPWLNLEVELDAKVRSHCLGDSGGLHAGGTHGAGDALGGGTVSARVAARITEVVKLCAARKGSVLAVIRGRRGSGRDSALAVLLHALGAAALTRDVGALRGEEDPLEPELSGATAVWDARGVDASPEDLSRASRFLSRSRGIAVALLDSHQDAPELPERAQLGVECDPAETAERAELWLEVLEARLPRGIECSEGTPVRLPAVALKLAQRSRAGVGLARRAVSAWVPADDVVAEPPESARAPAATLVRDLEQQLGALVQPSSTRGLCVERPQDTLDRLIVSSGVRNALSQLLALIDTAGSRDAERRRGVKAIFSGPSGTGKTLAARALAAHFEVPLFRVDLATMVSKWLGETEKNLRHAFEGAEAAGALLLFDEGDALFGKRGQVERGTDRYANVEVSYLLQALEAHDGVVIVTTNQRAAIDRAFLRRFDVVTEFHAPSKVERTKLWTQELGVAAEALPDSILRELAQVDLSGGHIAAASRLARALSSSRGETAVHQADLYAAIGAELAKLGAAAASAQWSARAEATHPRGNGVAAADTPTRAAPPQSNGRPRSAAQGG